MNLSFKYPKATFGAVILVASLSTLLAFAACGSTSKSDAPETLIPAESTLIGSVQVTEILEDPDFAALFENIDADLGDAESFDQLLDKDGDILSVEAQLDFISSESAARMGDAIGGFFDLFTALSPDERTRTLLDKIQVDTSGTRLTIRAEIPVSELEELVGTLGG